MYDLHCCLFLQINICLCISVSTLGTIMKVLGILLIAVGLVWGAIAYSMPISVKTEGKTISSGSYSSRIEPSEVYNLSLASERNLNFTFAAVITVVGTILFGFGSIQSTTNSSSNGRKCPFCAEEIQPEALVCKHCKSDLSSIPKNPENLNEQELNKLIEKLKLK